MHGNCKHPFKTVIVLAIVITSSSPRTNCANCSKCEDRRSAGVHSRPVLPALLCLAGCLEYGGRVRTPKRIVSYVLYTVHNNNAATARVTMPKTNIVFVSQQLPRPQSGLGRLGKAKSHTVSGRKQHLRARDCDKGVRHCTNSP